MIERLVKINVNYYSVFKRFQNRLMSINKMKKKKPMITNIKIEVIKNQNSDIYDQREYLLSGESR